MSFLQETPQPGHTERDVTLHEEIKHMIVNRPLVSQPIKPSRPELEVHHDTVVRSKRTIENIVAGTSGIPDFVLEQTQTIMTGVDALVDADKIQLKRLKTGFEALNQYRNKFELLNESGQRVVLAAETTNVDLTKNIWVGNRGILPKFNVSVLNCVGDEILHLQGHPGICHGQNSMDVYSGTVLLGSVEQGDDYGSTTYLIKDRNDNKLFKVTGPFRGCCGKKIPIKSRIEFNITTEGDAIELEYNIAKINKVPSFVTDGKLPELFGIIFTLKPLDLGVKLLLISTLIFLQFDFIKYDEREHSFHASEQIHETSTF